MRAERLLREVRIDPAQRIIVANKIADRALGQCVKLTPDGTNSRTARWTI